ncbi:hypothetical protein N0V84_006741 [Fusarium piperis]|uniref:Protein kinase domain-containing protein n=1 Tax=Fusarium piperis TaxID=1435070 RepID=A0A9W8WBF3_9HYPO|nr:hypothetical protein N0V84_006741 [Fusarium piperis]
MGSFHNLIDQESSGGNLRLKEAYEKTLEELGLLLDGNNHTWSQTNELRLDDLLVQLCVWGEELDAESGTLDWLQEERAKEAAVVRSNLDLVRSSITKINSVVSSQYKPEKLEESLEQLNLSARNLCGLSSALQITVGLGQNKGPEPAVKKYISDWSQKSSAAKPNIGEETKFLEESLGELQPLPKQSHGEEEIKPPDLLSILLECQRHGSRGEPFWPEGLLNRIMSTHGVLKSLHPSAEGYSSHIVPDECVKIYALLTLMKRAEKLVDFVKEGLQDQDLPLEYNGNDFWRHGKPLNCFQGWGHSEKEDFDHKQWGFVTPFLQLGPDHSLQHYELDIRTIIPWPPPMEAEEERWFAKQLFGLVGAVDTIHNPKPRAQEAPMVGYHGNIDPSNILCFRSARDPRGLLVLAGFGLSSLERESSRSDVPILLLGPPSYEAPEVELEGGQISPAYDIWGLGCVFLEFVTWFLGGRELLREFHTQRTTTHGLAFHHPRNAFYDWIRKLRDHQNCTELIRKVLLLIETKMLVVITKGTRRASSTELRQKFDQAYRKCLKGAMDKSDDPFFSPLSELSKAASASAGIESTSQDTSGTP